MIVKMTCPNCGASMEADDARTKIFCTYCGTQITSLKETVEINQNVNVSGRVVHVTDHTGEPSLVISYAPAGPESSIQIGVDSTAQNIRLTAAQPGRSFYLSRGKHRVEIRRGNLLSVREIYIPENNAPVMIYISEAGGYNINVQQPPYTVQPGESSELECSDTNTGHSWMAILGFILSFTGFLSIAGIALGIVSIVRFGKTKKQKLAIWAIIIGTVFGLTFISALAGASQGG